MTTVSALHAALTDAALEAATSKGLVRRAMRDLEAARAEIRRSETSEVVLTVDGETVRLVPAGIGRASCSCPSTSLCRHVLVAVLSLRCEFGGALPADADAEEVDPEKEIIDLDPAAISAGFGRAALAEAERILGSVAEADGTVATARVGESLVIGIPGRNEVHWTSGGGIAGMLSKDADTPGGKALRAAAVLAVRRQSSGTGLLGSVPAAPPAKGDGGAFLAEIAGRFAETARTGLSVPSRILEDRLLDLSLSSRADDMPRLGAILRSLAAGIARRTERTSISDPWSFLAEIAAGYALAEALRASPDDRALKGVHRRSFDEVCDIGLVGCGVEIWRTRTGARGATAHFLRTDAGAAGEPHSVTLARAAGQDPGFSPEIAARQEPVWGTTLEALSRGVGTLSGGRAAPDGSLSPGNGGFAFSADAPAWPQMQIGEGGFVVSEWHRLSDIVRHRFRPSLRRRPDAAIPVLLVARAVSPIAFDAVLQKARFHAEDGSGSLLEMEIDASGARGDRRMETAAGLAEAPGPFRFGVVMRQTPDGVAIAPLLVHRFGERQAESFDLEPERRHAPKPSRPSLTEWLRKAGERMAGRNALASPLPGRSRHVDRLLDDLSDALLALAELGGRMDDPARLASLSRQAASLDAAGMRPLAESVAALVAADAEAWPGRLLAVVYAVDLWRRLRAELPIVA